MNFGLIGLLSVFGLAMGAATLMGAIPRGFEGPLWLVIGILCAIWIARQLSGRLFLHGFLVGALNGALSPSIQVLFFPLYLKNNPYAAEAFRQLPGGFSPRLFVLVSAPFIAILSGLVVGLLAWVAGKAMRRKVVAAG